MGIGARCISDSALQIANYIGDGPFFFSRNEAKRPAVTLVWWKSDSLVQDFGAHVMRVGDEGHAHPGVNRFVLPMNVAGVSAGPEAENECPRDCQNQSQSKDQLLDGLPHGYLVAQRGKPQKVLRQVWRSPL